MELTPKTKVTTLLERYPFMLDFLTGLTPKFKLLNNPIARKTVGNVATLSQAAAIGGLEVPDFLKLIGDRIKEVTGEDVRLSTEGAETGTFTDSEVRHEVLKDIIRDLHSGASVESVKARFLELIRDIDASEISRMEQKLIEEGMPETEVKRLCDVHVQVFKESLEVKEVPVTPEGHPVHTFMVENRASENIMNKIETVVKHLNAGPDSESFDKYRENLKKLVSSLQKVNLHYLRKENQLFPLLEKHDISGPSQVMWSLHDDIRGMLKELMLLLEKGDVTKFSAASKTAIQTIRDMIYKEEHILYPVSVDTLSEEEWAAVKAGEHEIGYAWIEPVADNFGKNPEQKSYNQSQSAMKLDTGTMTLEQVNLLLKHLPVDISFVDENDEVAYYSATEERIFPRSPAVIGRKVQNCHPPKSVHVVKEILDDFRSGKRSTAEFWIQMQEKFIHIRYFAVRDADGKYKGCLEVSQDVTDIRKLEGENRLLD